MFTASPLELHPRFGDKLFGTSEGYTFEVYTSEGYTFEVYTSDGYTFEVYGYYCSMVKG